MILATGFIVFIIGQLLCDWNSRKPYTWKDRWFPYVSVVGIGMMVTSVTIFLARILP